MFSFALQVLATSVAANDTALKLHQLGSDLARFSGIAVLPSTSLGEVQPAKKEETEWVMLHMMLHWLPIWPVMISYVSVDACDDLEGQHEGGLVGQLLVGFLFTCVVCLVVEIALFLFFGDEFAVPDGDLSISDVFKYGMGPLAGAALIALPFHFLVTRSKYIGAFTFEAAIANSTFTTLVVFVICHFIQPSVLIQRFGKILKGKNPNCDYTSFAEAFGEASGEAFGKADMEFINANKDQIIQACKD